MIDVHTLIPILRTYNISEKTIQKIVKLKSIKKQKNVCEVKKIILVLKNNEFDLSIIEQCPTILAFGKEIEIEKIILTLKKYDIPLSIIEQCPTILVHGSTVDIYKKINLLKDNNINITSYSDWLIIRVIFTDYQSLCHIFDTKNFSKENLKFYLLLTNNYNKFYSYEDVIHLCQNLKIQIKDFFEALNLNSFLLKKLKKDSLWIGEHKPLSKEQINHHQLLIVNIVDLVSKVIFSKYPKLFIDDIKGVVLDLLLTNCGDIIYNFDDDSEILSKILYNYLYKSLIYTIFNKIFPARTFNEYEERKLTYDGIYNDLNSSNHILDLINETEAEEQLIKLMMEYIENNQEIDYSTIAQIMNIDEEQLNQLKKSLQKKILQLK